jgi:hypothetical protein
MSPIADDEVDLRLLVRWLGAPGARAGLMESKIWTVEALKNAALAMGIKVLEKMTKKELVDQVVKVANKRIQKPLEELYSMTFDELTRYLDSVGAEPEELLDLLKELNLSPGRESGRKNLVEFTARELSETGRFIRIAGKR